MADEESKNNGKKLTAGKAQKISKDDILEVIRKGKPFTLLKELISNKKCIFLTNLHHWYQLIYSS